MCCGFSPLCCCLFIPPSWFCPCVSTACPNVFTELQQGNACISQEPCEFWEGPQAGDPQCGPRAERTVGGREGVHGWEWGRKWNCPHPAALRKRVTSSTVLECTGGCWGEHQAASWQWGSSSRAAQAVGWTVSLTIENEPSSRIWIFVILVVKLEKCERIGEQHYIVKMSDRIVY